MKPTRKLNRPRRASADARHTPEHGTPVQGSRESARDCRAPADSPREFSDRRIVRAIRAFPAERGHGATNRKRDDFPRPISDFSARFAGDAESAEFEAWHAPRKWQVMQLIIAGLIGMPLAYVAFCLVMSLGDIF